MSKSDHHGSASDQQRVDVLYPDGTRGTMTPDEWRTRDTSLGIRRVGDTDDEPDVAEAVDEVTPTNEPEQ